MQHGWKIGKQLRTPSASHLKTMQFTKLGKWKLRSNYSQYTFSSNYAVSVYAEFHLRGLLVLSHSSIYALISPLFMLFLVKIYSIILFMWFSIYAVFPGKQKTRKRRRECIWLPKCDLSSVHDRDLIVIWREKVQFHPSFAVGIIISF